LLAKSGLSGIGSPQNNVGWKARNFGKPISHLEARLIPNPIRKVLSSMRTHRVRALLMGGQACVFYGAAEFSRDTDFAILSDTPNLVRLRKALAELQAEVIAVPPFEPRYLRKGHAIHFRCQHPEALRMRVDVMAKMRGVDAFAKLWRRRTVIRLPEGTVCDLLSLPDVVQAKKTQRDKDWPMIRRLVEAHYFEYQKKATSAQIKFWLLELRTPELLSELAKTHVAISRKMTAKRALLSLALVGEITNLEKALMEEQLTEREKDRRYWLPLRKELEKLRHSRRSTE
jgi:hypothetical protein